MCDHHQLSLAQRPSSCHGEVGHVAHLSEDIGGLFMGQSYSDVTLLIDKTRFHAHKVILAARSQYFRALLFGGLRESQPSCGEVELKDTCPKAFQHLLKYIYTGRMQLTELKEELLLDILGLAHRYGFEALQTAISDHLEAVLNIHNVCLIYDIASVYSLASLSRTCCTYMDRHAADIIQSDSFLTLSPTALREVVSRDSFCAPEIEIFKALTSWSERNKVSLNESADTHSVSSADSVSVDGETQGDEAGSITDINITVCNVGVDIVSMVRLALMSLDELLNVVRPSGLVSPDAILDAIKTKNESKDMELNYRGILVAEENVASARYNAQVVRGEMKSALLNGDTENYDLDHGFSRHPIDENYGQGIVVRLDMPAIVNSVTLLLWDRDMRSYSYYIEVSMDDHDYVRVVDHTRFLCRSYQYLRFPARVVRYIRIVGTHNSVNRVFHLVSFGCMFTHKPFELEQGIIVPAENVATIDYSACVIEGVSRSRNALINGDVRNYDWDSGYTCHQLGSGSIVIQLAQPYCIGSMRLLLWDCDSRSYSYYIEVSTDQQHWTMVADKTMDQCRAWQHITFRRRPITFIKIVGTHNTANEVFHCVHFGCPAVPGSSESDCEGACAGIADVPSPQPHLNNPHQMPRPPSPDDGAQAGDLPAFPIVIMPNDNLMPAFQL